MLREIIILKSSAWVVAKGLVVNKNSQEDNIECEFLKGTMELWVGEGLQPLKGREKKMTMIFYIVSTPKPLELIKLSKFVGYKINIEKSVAFLYLYTNKKTCTPIKNYQRKKFCLRLYQSE